LNVWIFSAFNGAITKGFFMREFLILKKPTPIFLALALLSLGDLLHAATFVVNKTADSDDGVCDSDCSLREAISAANDLPGAESVQFALLGTGPFVFTPNSPLPTLIDTVTIDGYSQAGSAVNTASFGSNAVLQIELRSNGNTATGLAPCAPNIVLRGLAITGFGSAVHSLSNGPTSCASVRDNLLIEGNFIGLQTDGTTARGNFQGVTINGAITTIGGTALAARNLISGNTRLGILFEGAGLAGSQVLGNVIGTDRSGVLDRGNTGAGIRIDAASDMTIGSPDAPNALMFNATGVQLIIASRRIILADNNYAQNDLLGIDLSASAVPNGVTPNDIDDVDFGSNDLQNFPELQTVERTAAGLRIRGFLDVPVATLNVPYRLTFYASSSCDSTGFGEGERVLGASTLNLTQSSGESFELFIDTPAPAIGSFITSTATGPSGTSEFSACLRLDGVVFRDGYE
jgi:trimeric autotransporter adhesin